MNSWARVAVKLERQVRGVAAVGAHGVVRRRSVPATRVHRGRHSTVPGRLHATEQLHDAGAVRDGVQRRRDAVPATDRQAHHRSTASAR